MTTLGNFAFERCEGLTGIELPAALSRMDYGVFKNCTKVESITINGNIANHSGFNMEGGEKYIDGGYRNPAYSYTAPFYNVGANAQELVISFGPGVTRVPSCLFATASSYSDGLFCHVKKVCLSDTVTVVGSYAFYNCQELTTIEMGNGVTNIENDAFDGCTSLTDIQWSESLRELGSAAFYACSSLTQVVLPENVTTVWDRVFKYCESLVSVTLPASTTVLNKGVFQQCKKLSSLTINGNLGDHSAYNLDTSERYIDGGYRKPAYAYTSPFYNAGANADSFTVTFAEGVTYIPAYLFGTGGLQSDNTYAAITKVVIPSSVTAIGKGAFHACYRLAEVSYGSNKKNWEKVAVGENNDSLLGAEIAFASVPEIAAPKLMGATLSPNGVKVTWEAVQNALFYRVLRREDLSESWTTVQDTQYLEYLDTSAVSGTKYTYTVVAVGEKGAVSDITDSLSITFLAAPKINTAINENMGVFLSWDVVPGAVAYRVFKRTSQGKWKKLGDTKAVVFLDETVKGGSTYTYTVRCISEDGSAYTSAYYSKGKKQKFIAAPVLTSAKNTSAGVVTVKWKKSKGAEKYQILRKPVNGSWSVVGTTKGTKFKDKTAKKGNTYVYTVGCISSKGASTSGKNETGLTVTVKK